MRVEFERVYQDVRTWAENEGVRVGQQRPARKAGEFDGVSAPAGVPAQLLCLLSQSDKRFPKYPPQPVLKGGSYDRRSASPDSGDQPVLAP